MSEARVGGQKWAVRLRPSFEEGSQPLPECVTPAADGARMRASGITCSPPHPSVSISKPSPAPSDLVPASCQVTEDKLSKEVALFCSTPILPYCV